MRRYNFIFEQLNKLKKSQSKAKKYISKLLVDRRNLNIKISWKSPKIIGGLAALIIIVSGASYYLSMTTSAVAVIINGTQAGLVRNVASGESMVNDFLKQQGEEVGVTAKTHDQIKYEPVRVNQAAFLEGTLKEEELKDQVSTYIDGYELKVNDSVIAILPDQAALDEVLKKYQDYYSKPRDENKVTSVSFAEDVINDEVEADPTQVKTVDQVLKMLIDGKSDTENYTVKEDDSLWLIARQNDMHVADILAANPGTTEDTVLKPGQTIKLNKETPYLTVISTGTYTGTEKIPYDVETKTDHSLRSGQTKVVQQGSNGSKMVTYTYERKNGVDVKKQVLDEKIVQDPVNKVIAEGPASAPVNVAMGVSRGSGRVSGLAWPLSGGITSYFGSRAEFGDFHTGIDIGGSTGEPYYAAASGTVVAAGWDGGYGKMILIDNGNGVSTRYGHSSKLLVSVGQHVNKGQEIGLVGSTGNATGPHLHFEVLINGTARNPLNYLP